MPIQPRIHIIDIETVDSVDSDNAPAPIPCFTIYDSYTQVYNIFSFGLKQSDISQVPLRLHEYWQANVTSSLLKYSFHSSKIINHNYPTERQMIGSFINFIKQNQPDIIAAWNIDFDLPYLIKRIENLKIPSKALSEVERVYIDKNKHPVIGGIVCFDSMFEYAHIQLQDLRSKSLDFCANREFKVGKMSRISIKEMLIKNPSRLLAYNIIDVQLTMAITQSCQLLQTAQTIEKISNAGLDNQSPLRIVDSFIISFLKTRKMAAPTGTYIKGSGKKEGGAYVHEALIGKHENVIVLDFKGYYTSMIMSANVCGSTYATNKESGKAGENGFIHTPNGAMFRKDKQGVIPEILIHIKNERGRHKELMKYAMDEQTKNVEDLIQQAFKRIGNIFYGQFKNPYFRLAEKAIAEAITSACMALTLRTNMIIENINPSDLQMKDKLCVIYNDTDSGFIKVSGQPDVVEMRIIGKFLEKHINSLIPSLVKEMFNIDNNFIEIEFDDKKIMKSLLQMPKQGDRTEGAKKRYIYLSYKDDNTLDPDPHFVGVDVIRSDTSPLMVEVQTKLAKMILNNEPYSNIRRYLFDLYNNFNKQAPDSLLIKETLHQFDNIKSNSPQVVGALYANKYMQKSFKSGSTVYYIYLKSLPAGYPRMETDNLKSLCLDYNESVPKNFLEHIDWEKMRDIILIKPTETILEAVGYKWSEIVTGTRENTVKTIKVMTTL